MRRQRVNYSGDAADKIGMDKLSAGETAGSMYQIFGADGAAKSFGEVTQMGDLALFHPPLELAESEYAEFDVTGDSPTH